MLTTCTMDSQERFQMNIKVDTPTDKQIKYECTPSWHCLLASKDDTGDLEKLLRKCHLFDERPDQSSSSASSEDEEEEEKEGTDDDEDEEPEGAKSVADVEAVLMPRCPDRNREINKQKMKQGLHPYTQYKSSDYTSGGNVVVNRNYTSEALPHSVQERRLGASGVTKGDTSDLPSVTEEDERIMDRFIREKASELPPEVVQLYFSGVGSSAPPVKSPLYPQHPPNYIDGESCPTLALETASSSTDSLKSPQLPQIRSDPPTYPNSPDSSYGTLSPSSIPTFSPYPPSIQSPKRLPRNEKRLSESDSISESDSGIGLETNTIYNLYEPFSPVLCSKVRRNSLVRCTVSESNSGSPLTVSNTNSMGGLRALRLAPDCIAVSETDPQQPASSRLEKLMKASVKEIEWARVIHEGTQGGRTALSGRDHRGQTKLMRLIAEGPSSPRFYERLFTLVRYLVKEQLLDLITERDNEGRSALYAAAVRLNTVPLVARFIADTLVESKIQPGEDVDSDRNSLLHTLASLGDSHAQVLTDLLHSQGFSLRQRNSQGDTPLLTAVRRHARDRSTLACVKQLVKWKAFVSDQDGGGSTALHVAVSESCDPPLLKALLQAPSAREAISTPDLDRNTPLHLAARRNDIPIDRHKDVISQLISSGARHDLRNNQEKVALALVAPDRKEDIRKIMNKK